MSNLAQPLQPERVAARIGLYDDDIAENYSMVLGAKETTLMKLVTGYSMIANGGRRVAPWLIERIDDRNGQPVYAANPARACLDCQERLLDTTPAGPPPPATPSGPANAPATASTSAKAVIGDGTLPDDAHNGPAPPRLAPRVIDTRNDYLIVSMMMDVIRRGTGSAAMALKRDDLAGKTGSTNDHRDAWFVGFNTHEVASVWVGFDDFTSLGKGEFGAKAALPIWMDYMAATLKDQPSGVLAMPPGISTVQINRSSGMPTAGA